MLISGSNLEKIKDLKQRLSNEFEIKILGITNQILGMRISKNRSRGVLRLSLEYNKKILTCFNMEDTKHVSITLIGHFKLSMTQSPSIDVKIEHISRLSYLSVVGSLIYEMVYTKPDIVYAVRVVSRFMIYLGREH